MWSGDFCLPVKPSLLSKRGSTRNQLAGSKEKKNLLCGFRRVFAFFRFHLRVKTNKILWIFSSIKCFDLSYFKYLLIFLLNPTSCYGLFSKINPTAAFVVSTHAFTGGPLYLCQQPLTFVTDVCLFFFLQTVSSQLTYWTFPFLRRSPKCRLIIKHGRRRCVIQIREITGSVQHLTLVFSGSRSVLLFLLFLPVYW